ncbi:uncharacterized protein BJ171DRAFT_503905 [Polychytrium aggregatum]|uniref:uncharacterized protein n=1 Tax=Polychytrium aggregatum TaxID=110093 RepID=UPI0022FE0533|nr:uncharacterized protein BJ171DRAFT_503905 [Polychytrium aggregatum]KAI9204866.1 hypothetical protein BJ171DRAFT_503905 [Polychytrium aggregatum]
MNPTSTESITSTNGPESAALETAPASQQATIAVPVPNRPASGVHVSSVRGAYETFGVEGFYNNYGHEYTNPHTRPIIKCIESVMAWLAAEQAPGVVADTPEYVVEMPSPPLCIPPAPSQSSIAALPKLRVLDLACGSGEAALALSSWFQRSATARSTYSHLEVYATDPFTHEAFLKRFQHQPDRYAFEDIAQGCYPTRSFDVCICSFALHLLDEQKLFSTLYALARMSQWLIIVSPHKRPHIKDTFGWGPLMRELTIDRVHIRCYRSNEYDYAFD